MQSSKLKIYMLISKTSPLHVFHTPSIIMHVVLYNCAILSGVYIVGDIIITYMCVGSYCMDSVVHIIL